MPLTGCWKHMTSLLVYEFLRNSLHCLALSWFDLKMLHEKQMHKLQSHEKVRGIWIATAFPLKQSGGFWEESELWRATVTNQ